jgi:hypothetical protein
MTTYTEVQRFEIENHQVLVVQSCRPTNCQTVASGLDDGRILIWRTLDAAALVTWARDNRYVRQLNCFEGEQYRVALPTCES